MDSLLYKYDNIFAIFANVKYLLMIDGLIGNNILLFFTQGAHFLLLTLFSIKLLSQPRIRIKLFLGLMLTFWVLLHVKDLMIYHNEVVISQEHLNWITMTDQLTIPFCVIFQMEVIHPKWLNWTKTMIAISPFVLLFVIYNIAPSSVIVYLSLALTIAYALFIVIYTAIQCNKMPRNYPNRRAAFILVNSLVVGFFAWVLSCVLYQPMSDIVYYIVSGMAWAVIFYTIENIYTEQQLVEELDFVAEISTPVHEYPFADSFSQLMEVEQAYLNPEISIAEVARQIGTNRSYLSDFLNHSCNSSFVDYVNNLRLEYAENLMRNDMTLSIEAMAILSGFNSLSTFRRAFNKKYGVTPSKYRQNLYKAAKQ